ncbi:MAG: hypothetical protein M5U26_23200 [Planctomycetota bacterium]|nr:hypothetical protein [Planctomycetota bacterium]
MDSEYQEVSIDWVVEFLFNKSNLDNLQLGFVDSFLKRSPPDIRNRAMMKVYAVRCSHILEEVCEKRPTASTLRLFIANCIRILGEGTVSTIQLSESQLRHLKSTPPICKEQRAWKSEKVNQFPEMAIQDAIDNDLLRVDQQSALFVTEKGFQLIRDRPIELPKGLSLKAVRHFHAIIKQRPDWFKAGDLDGTYGVEQRRLAIKFLLNNGQIESNGKNTNAAKYRKTVRFMDELPSE